jgi:regulator of cell morphogenesis and NO signaling
MNRLDLDTPIGRWVAEYPATARFLESLQIDYCCHGSQSLSQACASPGLNPTQVLEQLRDHLATCTPVSENWLNRPLTELSAHIEQTHHAYLKSELPRLSELIEKVVNALGVSHPELLTLRSHFADLRAELEPHLMKEERILFPAIRQLEQTATQLHFPFGTVANPIHMMEHEHDHAGDELAKIRHVTNDFQLPSDACTTYRVLFDSLQQLEQDLHQHIHLENNILFPRAMKLECNR